jgi:ankyrin repeat protein
MTAVKVLQTKVNECWPALPLRTFRPPHGDFRCCEAPEPEPECDLEPEPEPEPEPELEVAEWVKGGLLGTLAGTSVVNAAKEAIKSVVNAAKEVKSIAEERLATETKLAANTKSLLALSLVKGFEKYVNSGLSAPSSGPFARLKTELASLTYANAISNQHVQNRVDSLEKAIFVSENKTRNSEYKRKAKFICEMFSTGSALLFASIMTGYIPCKVLVEIESAKILNDAVILEIATMQYGINIERMVNRSETNYLSASAIQVAKFVHVKNMCEWYHDLAKVRAVVTLKACQTAQQSINAVSESPFSLLAKSTGLFSSEEQTAGPPSLHRIEHLVGYFCTSLTRIEELRRSISEDVYPAIPSYSRAIASYLCGVLTDLHISAAQISFTATDPVKSTHATIDIFRSTELLSACEEHLSQAAQYFKETTDWWRTHLQEQEHLSVAMQYFKERLEWWKTHLQERLSIVEVFSAEVSSRLTMLEDATFERLVAQALQKLEAVPSAELHDFCSCFARLGKYAAEHSEAQNLLREQQLASRECKQLADQAKTELDTFELKHKEHLEHDAVSFLDRVIEIKPKSSDSDTERALLRFLCGYARLVSTTGANSDKAALSDLYDAGAIMSTRRKRKVRGGQKLLMDLIQTYIGVGQLRRHQRTNNSADLKEAIESIEQVVLGEERQHDVELNFAELLWGDITASLIPTCVKTLLKNARRSADALQSAEQALQLSSHSSTAAALGEIWSSKKGKRNAEQALRCFLMAQLFVQVDGGDMPNERDIQTLLLQQQQKMVTNKANVLCNDMSNDAREEKQCQAKRKHSEELFSVAANRYREGCSMLVRHLTDESDLDVAVVAGRLGRVDELDRLVFDPIRQLKSTITRISGEKNMAHRELEHLTKRSQPDSKTGKSQAENTLHDIDQAIAQHQKDDTQLSHLEAKKLEAKKTKLTGELQADAQRKGELENLVSSLTSNLEVSRQTLQNFRADLQTLSIDTACLPLYKELLHIVRAACVLRGAEPDDDMQRLVEVKFAPPDGLQDAVCKEFSLPKGGWNVSSAEASCAISTLCETLPRDTTSGTFHEYLSQQVNSWFQAFWPARIGSIANAKYYLREQFGLSEGQVHQVLLFAITAPMKQRLIDYVECRQFLDSMVQTWCHDGGLEPIEKGKRVFVESWCTAAKHRGKNTFSGLVSANSHTLRVFLAVKLEKPVKVIDSNANLLDTIPNQRTGLLTSVVEELFPQTIEEAEQSQLKSLSISMLATRVAPAIVQQFIQRFRKRVASKLPTEIDIAFVERYLSEYWALDPEQISLVIVHSYTMLPSYRSQDQKQDTEAKKKQNKEAKKLEDEKLDKEALANYRAFFDSAVEAYADDVGQRVEKGRVDVVAQRAVPIGNEYRLRGVFACCSRTDMRAISANHSTMQTFSTELDVRAVGVEEESRIVSILHWVIRLQAGSDYAGIESISDVATVAEDMSIDVFNQERLLLKQLRQSVHDPGLVDFLLRVPAFGSQYPDWGSVAKSRCSTILADTSETLISFATRHSNGRLLASLCKGGGAASLRRNDLQRICLLLGSEPALWSSVVDYFPATEVFRVLTSSPEVIRVLTSNIAALQVFQVWFDRQDFPIELVKLRVCEGHTLAHFCADNLRTAGSMIQTIPWLGYTSLSACTNDGITVLHCCARSGNTWLMEALMQSSSDRVSLALDLRTRKGLAALHLAAKNGHLEAVKLLIAARAHVDAVSKNGRTPLMLAVKEQAAGWRDVTSVLIQRGADAQLKASAGFSALSLALMRGGVMGTGLAECLDDVGADQAVGLCVHGLVSDCARLPVSSSVVGTPEFRRLDELIANGADVNVRLPQRSTSALALAVHPNVVERLLKAGAHVGARDSDGNTALHCIIMTKMLPEDVKLSIVQMLLTHGAEYKNSVLNKSRKSPYDLSTGSIRQLLDAEELRRKVDYEKIQKQWEEQAASSLSAVETLLQQPTQVKRAAISDHISAMSAKLIARREKQSHSTAATDRSQPAPAPGLALQASWGQGYADSPWELFLCKTAVGTISRLEESIRSLVFRHLHDIARGDWQHASVLTAPSGRVKLHQTLLLAGACIVWEVGIMYSARRLCYADAIKIWSIETDTSNVDKVVSFVEESHSAGLESTLCVQLLAVGSRSPRTYKQVDDGAPNTSDLSGAKLQSYMYTPDAQLDNDGFSILQFHLVDDHLATCYLSKLDSRTQGFVRNPDFLICATEDQTRVLINHSQSNGALLLLGRSGTGKTTLLIHKMLHAYLDNMVARQAACKAGVVPPKHLRQIFVTNNAVLVSSVRKQWVGLVDGIATASPVRDPPTDWNMLEDEHFPLFLTRNEFFKFIDSRLGEASFFKAGQEWHVDEQAPVRSLDGFQEQQSLLKQQQVLILEEQTGGRTKETMLALRKVEKCLARYHLGAAKASSIKSLVHGQFVDFPFFLRSIWPKIAQASVAISASCLWTEAQSFLSPTMSEDQYLQLSKKQAGLLKRNTDRIEVFSLYHSYRRVLKDIQGWDTTDLVRHIAAEMSTKAALLKGAISLDSILVDETQDFTQLECQLLLQLCESPNQMVMVGDTAQTISKVQFRFAELRLAFHELNAVDSSIVVPEIAQLTINYRE